MIFFAKPKSTYRCLLSMLVLICITLTSCFEEPLKLNRADKKVVDSIYNAERLLLLHDLDSICTANFDDRVAEAIDSIMEKRLKEIARLKRRD